MNCLSTIRLIFPHPVDTTAEFCIGTEVCCSVPFKGSDVLLEVPQKCFAAELPPTVRAAGFCCFLRDILPYKSYEKGKDAEGHGR